jgi:hypothetical protein
MGESLPKLHSTIISRHVTAKHGETCSREAGSGRGENDGGRASAQGELDDAEQDEDQQGGGDCHIQRVAHYSPDISVAVLSS